MPLPTDRTTSNTAEEHVADHNTIHAAVNGIGTTGLADYAAASRTSGNLTLNNAGSWANVDTGLDLVLTAAVGDLIEYSLSCAGAASANVLVMDVATIVGGSPVNYFATGGAAGDFGNGSWYTSVSNTGDIPLGGSTRPRTLVSGDISSGTVTLRLRYRTTVGARTVYANATLPLMVWAKNLGPTPA